MFLEESQSLAGFSKTAKNQSSEMKTNMYKGLKIAWAHVWYRKNDNFLKFFDVLEMETRTL